MVLGGGGAVMNTKLTLGLFPGNLSPVHGMPIAAANMSDIYIGDSLVFFWVNFRQH